MSITAKVKVSVKTPQIDHGGQEGEGQTTLNFTPDYADDRNKEWSKYTPCLSLSMTVLDSVAEKFELGQAFTLTFTPESESK